ncbi:MAG: hypothetical protein KAH32_01925, partial [Chlamydiia bacterium]|nr:hypothetical protein [Chlamydiia bacterium]
MSVDTQQQTVEKTVIFQAGSILSDLQLVFSLPVSSNFIGVRSSKHFLSNIENDIEADLCDCEFNIIRLDAMEKISCTISSSDQNSIKIKTAKVLKKNAQYYLVISSKKACLSTSIAMNISIDIFNPSEENVIYSTHTLNISPKPMKSICIDVPSAISSGQSIYAIIKYLDKFGNITKPKNINNLRLVSLNIEKLDGSVISTGVKWSILEPKNGYAFLSGMQVHETGAYFITLNFEGKCIAKSNIFYVSGSGTPYYYKSIHWNYSNPIANSQSIDKITYRLFPTHYAESISPFVVNKGIYEANAFISKVPVNINFDVITLNAINESKDCYALHYKNPSTSIHKCAGKLNISHATSYDARRSISRYIKLSNIYSWDDPNLQKNKEDIFVDIKLFNKISIHEVISRLKVAYSKRSKYPLALYSLSSESNDAH